MSSDGVFLDYHVKNPEALLAPPEAFLGKSMHEVLPPWLADALQRAFERALATNEPERLEYSLESLHERRFYEACIVRFDSDRLLSIVRDITDRKRAELDAAAQRQELAHLNRVLILAEQSGALAHELSQPLAAILTNAQAARRLLDQSPLDLDEAACGAGRRDQERQEGGRGHRPPARAPEEAQHRPPAPRPERSRSGGPRPDA